MIAGLDFLESNCWVYFPSSQAKNYRQNVAVYKSGCLESV